MSTTDSVQSQRGTIVPQLLLTPAGLIAGGKVWGRKAEYSDLLKSDKLELSKKATAKLTPEQTDALSKINEQLAAQKTYTEQAENAAKEVFGEATELTPEEYVKKCGYESVADLTGDTGKYQTAKKSVEDISTKISTKEAELTKAADDAAKTKINEEIKQLKGCKNIAQNTLDNHATNYKLVTGAGEGKVTKDAFKNEKLSSLLTENKTKATEYLQKLGKLVPKKWSWKKGFIGLAAGLVTGIIISKIISPSAPEPEQTQA